MSRKKTESNNEPLLVQYAKMDDFKGTIVWFVVIAAIAAFIAYICVGARLLYIKAPYKETVEATLIEVNKNTEVWEDKTKIDDYGNKEKHRNTDIFLIYEYELHGKKDTLAERSLTGFHKVGSKKKFKFYSTDGVEYKKQSYNLLSDAAAVVCSLLSLLLIYATVKMIILRIKFARSGQLIKKKTE